MYPLAIHRCTQLCILNTCQVRGHTRRVDTCRLRAIKSISGKMSRALAHQALTFFLRATLKNWEWPRDKAGYPYLC